MSDKKYWDQAYKSGRSENTPWESGEPDNYLVRLVKDKKIPGKAVIDTCSGLGTQAIFLAENGYRVTGIELSPTAVARARSRAEEAGLKIDFVNGNVQELPFEDGQFDFIFDRGCLHHQYDGEMTAYLAETKRVLKSGGRMYIVSFAGRFSRAGLEDMFSDDFIILDYQKFRWKAADDFTREFQGILLEKK